MPLFPLLIGPTEKRQIKDLMDRAMERKLTLPVMKIMIDAAEKKEPIDMSLFTELTIYLPTCYSVTYTVEEMQENIWFRHLSVAIEGGRKGFGPSVEAMEMIMTEFGFVGGIKKCEGYQEPLPGGTLAINIIQPLSGSWETSEKAETA